MGNKQTSGDAVNNQTPNNRIKLQVSSATTEDHDPTTTIDDEDIVESSLTSFVADNVISSSDDYEGVHHTPMDLKQMRLAVERKIKTSPFERGQWVKNILEYSSQYSSDWAANNVIGESDTFPNYGDLTTCWAPRAAVGANEHLIVEFDHCALIGGIHIYETFNPGAIFRVSCLPVGKWYSVEEVVDSDTVDENGNNPKKSKFNSNPEDWMVLYQGSPQQSSLQKVSRIFVPPLASKYCCVTKIIKIEMDTSDSESWSEIDAIRMFGIICDVSYQQPPQQQQLDSTDATTTTTVTTTQQRHDREYVEDLNTLFINEPSTDCISLKLPIRKKMLASTPQNPLYIISPKMYYIHEFLLRYRFHNSTTLDKYIVKSEDEIRDMSPSSNTFSITESAANTIINYLYSGSLFLSPNMFKEEGEDNGCAGIGGGGDLDYTSSEEFVREILQISTLFGIDNLRQACAETIEISSMIDVAYRQQVTISIFNQFASTLSADDLHADMRSVYEGSCTMGENYDRKSAPDVKLVFSNIDLTEGESGGDNTTSPLTPSRSSTTRPCIYAHSSILKARCTYFKTMFNWGNVSENPFRFSTDNINEIDIPDVKYEIFLKMIKFMYCGHLDKHEISPEEAIPLYVAQNQYLLDSSVSCEVIRENVSENNVLDILSLAIQFSYQEISDFCTNYLINHIEQCYLLVRNRFKQLLNSLETTDEQQQKQLLSNDPMYQHLVESSYIWDLVINNDHLSYISQWAYRLIGSSSEYNGWPATNVIGPSNTYPDYGDIKTAWAPKASKGTKEFLELEFYHPIYITSIHVYETYNPGALVKVTAFTESQKEQEVLFEIDEPEAHLLPPQSRINTIPIVESDHAKQVMDKKFKYLRLDMDTSKNSSWYEIDAVLMCGFIEKKNE